MVTEVWLHGFPIPRRTVDLATRAEGWGFDGLLLVDSENLVGDPMWNSPWRRGRPSGCAWDPP